MHSRFSVPFLMALFLLPSCRAAEPDAGVSLSEIQANPGNYYRKAVSVRGEIDEVYGPNAFSLGTLGGGEGMLVVVPATATVTGSRPGDNPFYPEDVVAVTGTVQPFVIPDIEQEFDLDLVPELEVDYEGSGPILVAGTVALGSAKDEVRSAK